MCLGKLLIPVLLIAGCAPFPDLDKTIPPQSRKNDFPKLVPIESILVRAAEQPADTNQNTEAVNARVAALNARAERLRRTSASEQN